MTCCLSAVSVCLSLYATSFFHNHKGVEAVVFCVLFLPSRLANHVTTSSSSCFAHLHCVSAASLNCSSSCFAHLHCVSAAGLNCSSSCCAHLHCKSAACLNCSSSCCAHLHCVSAAGPNCIGAMYRFYDLDMLLQEDMLLTCIVECIHPMMCHIQILRCGHSTEAGHVAHLRCVLECSGSIPSWTFY